MHAFPKTVNDSPKQPVNVLGSLAPPDLSTLLKPEFFNEESFAAFLASSEESVKLNLKELDSSPDAFAQAFSVTATNMMPINEPLKKDQLTEEDEEFTITKFVAK